MRQKIKAITHLALTTNSTGVQHMIDLIGYYKKFLPIFGDMIRTLSELTRKHVPFKWMEQCQKSLDYIKQVITTNPILVDPDPDKQYYLFMDSSKHSWNRILVQYTEQAREDDTKFKVPHHQKSGAFQEFPPKTGILHQKRHMPSTCIFTKWYFT